MGKYRMVDYNGKEYHVNGIGGSLKERYEKLNTSYTKRELLFDSPTFFTTMRISKKIILILMMH